MRFTFNDKGINLPNLSLPLTFKGLKIETDFNSSIWASIHRLHKNILFYNPMYCQGGSYLLEFLDYYAAGWPYLFIGLSEFIIIVYFYGIQVG